MTMDKTFDSDVTLDTFETQMVLRLAGRTLPSLELKERYGRSVRRLIDAGWLEVVSTPYGRERLRCSDLAMAELERRIAKA